MLNGGVQSDISKNQLGICYAYVNVAYFKCTKNITDNAFTRYCIANFCCCFFFKHIDLLERIWFSHVCKLHQGDVGSCFLYGNVNPHVEPQMIVVGFKIFFDFCIFCILHCIALYLWICDLMNCKLYLDLVNCIAIVYVFRHCEY